jgi:putative endonuclease
MYYVYQLRCANGSPYTGCTSNLEARIERHAKGYVFSTKDKLPIELEMYVAFSDKYKAFAFEKYLKSGQGSGISLRYFYMLAGETNLIKPDRMIMRFLEENVGQKVSIDESQKLLRNVCAKINEKGYLINAKKLDNLIWNYQRTL